jgi:hypothetical protein
MHKRTWFTKAAVSENGSVPESILPSNPGETIPTRQSLLVHGEFAV